VFLRHAIKSPTNQHSVIAQSPFVVVGCRVSRSRPLVTSSDGPALLPGRRRDDPTSTLELLALFPARSGTHRGIGKDYGGVTGWGWVYTNSESNSGPLSLQYDLYKI
jgi:hypothetical protein